MSVLKWRKYIHYINDSRQTSYGFELMLKPNWEASPDAVIVAPDVVPDDDAALLDKELLDAALLNDEPLDAALLDDGPHDAALLDDEPLDAALLDDEPLDAALLDDEDELLDDTTPRVPVPTMVDSGSIEKSRVDAAWK